MDYKEFTCAFCGKKGIDKSWNGCKRFCSSKCKEAYYRSEKRYLVAKAERSCIHNKEIICELRRCSKCG